MTAQQIVFRLGQAINLMETGAFHDAMLALDDALSNLKAYFQQTADDNLISSSNSEALEPQVEAVLGPSSAMITSSLLRHDASPIFGRAMSIQGLNESFCCREEDVAIVAAVLLFNKGLIYHLLGLPENIDAYLSRAKAMYEKSLALINACSMSPMDNFWLKSMLLHHLGELLFCLCDRSGELLCWINLEQLLSHRRLECGRHELTNEIIELQLNVTMLLESVHRPAPAA
jgi:hypothetical protein